MAFLCDAIYKGSHVVEGGVSPPLLNSLAELVLLSDSSRRGYAQVCIGKVPRGDRCQLQIDEQRLRISSCRRDEGFESDSESSSVTGGCEETLCSSPEIKVIKDHVLRLEKLIRKDSGIHRCVSQSSEDGGSTSLSSSSGAESEEEMPKAADHSSSHLDIEKKNNSNASPIENSGSDNFEMSDILFFHVLPHRQKVVAVVVKSVDSSLVAAHVFECLSSEAARTLYNCYYSASNKYKLNKYRLSRTRNEGDKATLDRIHVSIRNIKRKFELPPETTNSKSINGLYNSIVEGKAVNSRMSNNINVIEIKSDQHPSRLTTGMMQRIDENGVTHIEIESVPSSLAPSNLPPAANCTQPPKPRLNHNELLSALDRLSLHFSSSPDSYLSHVGVTTSCPNSLIQTSLEGADRDKDRKSRQRQPPRFIKKVDRFPEKRIERRNRSRSEESRKPPDHFTGEGQRSKIVECLDKLISESPKQHSQPQPNKTGSPNQISGNSERQSRPRNVSRPPRDQRNRPNSSHKKAPAPPPPPPRRHPSNPSLMLVPTKSGQENPRSCYPKESHIIRGSKIVRVDYPLSPWKVSSDVNNNPKIMFYSNRSGRFRSHEFHGYRSVPPPELRKRSRSKSPIRRPMPHRYMDATFNLAQKIKDLSDSVIQTWKSAPNGPLAAVSKRERKLSPHLPISNSNTSNKDTRTSPSPDDPIRPVIKRGKNKGSILDGRRVTFSAYATVQLMDSTAIL